MANEKQWTGSPALETHLRGLRALVEQAEAARDKANAVAAIERANHLRAAEAVSRQREVTLVATRRVADLERGRAGLKEIVVALAERLVRLETRMANAGEAVPPLTPKERDAINSMPVDVRDRALAVGVAGQNDEDCKASGTWPAHLDYSGNQF